jgi:hypothetical protein
MCDLKKWLEYENCNKKRLCWSCIFLLLGLILLIISGDKFNIISKISKHWPDLLWVAGWSSVGISAGLINRRIKTEEEKEKIDDRENQHEHYVIYYFIFALFVSSLAAFALGRYDNGALNLPLSALIGLTIGFVSKKINDLAPIK